MHYNKTNIYLFLHYEIFEKDLDAINNLEIVLTQAIQSQSIADVPLGSFLSGGIDSSVITANKLIYDGNKKVAKLRDKVIYIKNNEEVRTNILNYYIDLKKGEFFEGGNLKDGTNELSSIVGFFFGNNDVSVFYKDVKFIGEDYILKTDSMTYNSKIQEAVTFSFTEIFSKDSVYVESLGGRFRQTKNESNLISS